MRQRGFSVLELLIVVLVFTVITGAVFGLLNVTQQRFQMEVQFLDTFQSARLGLDQITRDVHSAGYPALSSFAPGVDPGVNAVTAPFAWSPGYAAATCVVGAGCTNPGAFDLIMETDVDPENQNGVEWVRYRLNGTILERGVASKVVGADPVASTAGVMVPFIEGVVNNADAATIAAIQADYPGMFPGGNPVPVFTYPEAPVDVRELREVAVTLILLAPSPDPKTGQLRVVTLTGLARRLNPNQ